MYFSSLQKKLIACLCILSLIVCAFDGLLFYSALYAPYHVTTRYSTLRLSGLPESMDQVSVVFVSDLEYSAESSQQTIDSIFQTIRGLEPDVFLFGGDLFAYNAECTDEARAMLAEGLRQIKAPLGKFAVLGEQDLVDANRKAIVEDVYAQSHIEVLENASVLLANGSAQGVRLAGLGIEPSYDFLQALAGSPLLVLSHYPDHFEKLKELHIPVSYALAGNSHGTQIDWPILGGYRKFEGSLQINRAHTPRLGFDYIITSGLGCIEVPVRINAPVQIEYFTLAK